MMIMVPNIPDEANWAPDPEAVAAMGRYNEELTKAGVLLALDGLHPPAKGARVAFAGGRANVTDGPFTEAKEIIGGYWMIEAQLEGGGGRVGVALSRGRRRHHRGPPGLRDERLPAGGAGRGPAGRRRVTQQGATREQRAVEAVWRIESAALIGGARAATSATSALAEDLAQDALRRRARAVAAVGRPGEPGRLADGHRQAPRDRPACAAARRLERKHAGARTRARASQAGRPSPSSSGRSRSRSATTCCA